MKARRLNKRNSFWKYKGNKSGKEVVLLKLRNKQSLMDYRIPKIECDFFAGKIVQAIKNNYDNFSFSRKSFNSGGWDEEFWSVRIGKEADLITF